MSLIYIYSQPRPSQILWGWWNSSDLDKWETYEGRETIENKEKGLCMDLQLIPLSYQANNAESNAFWE